jgi:hypothetical protein
MTDMYWCMRARCVTALRQVAKRHSFVKLPTAAQGRMRQFIAAKGASTPLSGATQRRGSEKRNGESTAAWPRSAPAVRDADP